MKPRLPEFKALKITGARTFESTRGIGAMANIAIGKIAIAVFQDAGDGGMADVRFLSAQTRAEAHATLACNGILNTLFDTRKDLFGKYASATDIPAGDVLALYVEQHLDDKELAKLKKMTAYGIVSRFGFSQLWPKKYVLNQIAADNLDGLQRAYDKVVSALSDDDRIVNSADDLRALGVVVQPDRHLQLASN